ncbi:hypothetical protein V1511DRAFT_485396 [Dipodascopsis uninucleata]
MQRFFANTFGGGTGDETSNKHKSDAAEHDHVLVKYGKQFLRVDFTSPNDIENGNASVGDVRATTARYLGQPKTDVLLVHAGKKLKNDRQTLASLNIKSGAKLLCLVSKPRVQPEIARKQVEKPKLPTDPIDRIELVLKSAEEELVPKINEFVSSPPAKDSDKKERQRILSELILQRLFALDEVDTHENPEARKRRKEAVNQLHEYQARVDSILQKKE